MDYSSVGRNIGVNRVVAAAGRRLLSVVLQYDRQLVQAGNARHYGLNDAVQRPPSHWLQFGQSPDAEGQMSSEKSA